MICLDSDIIIDFLKGKKEAIETTRFVFLKLAKYMAPFTPFFAESVYQKLKTNSFPESVHLENWSQAEEINVELLENMAK